MRKRLVAYFVEAPEGGVNWVAQTNFAAGGGVARHSFVEAQAPAVWVFPGVCASSTWCSTLEGLWTKADMGTLIWPGRREYPALGSQV